MLGLVLGAVAGSAVAPVLRGAVARYSVPYGESWRAACPGCSRGVRWLPPTGRCPGCRGRIGPGAWRVEPVAAAVGAALCAAADRWHGPLLLWAGALGVVLGFVDASVRRLPDVLTLTLGLGTAALLTVAAVADGHPSVLLRCLLVALAAWALFEIPAWFDLIGFGDGKLVLGLGALLGLYGWRTAFSALFLTALLGGLWSVGLAVVALARRRRVRGLEVPYGPFMLLGTLLAVLAAA
ncbi:prepilin peptidase [Kitasatospora sp. NPDC050543]|uniref:prepilin peptidase n=1 Tax=Kitasatospora sp. NPDC050543 TaxID=3364054 RepID=UPI0037B1544C